MMYKINMLLDNKKILLIFLFSIIFIEFFLIRTLLSCSFIFADDTHSSLSFDISNIFSNPHVGAPISSFFDRLFGVYIPIWTNHHPSYFKGIYFSFLETIIIFIFSYFLAKLLFEEKTNKKENAILFLISFLFSNSLLFLCVQHQPYMIFIYDGFFRILLPILFLIPLFHLYKQNKYNLYRTITILIISFLCCCMNEMTCTIVTFSQLLIFFFIYLKKVNKKELLIQSLIILFSILGLYLYLKSGGFSRKSFIIPNKLDYFISILKYIPEYTIIYIKMVLLKHIVPISLIILQNFFLSKYLLTDNHFRKIRLVVFSYLLSTFVFFFMLIGLGKTHYYGSFWLVHEDLHTMFDILLCILNFIFFSFIIQHQLLKHRYITFIILIGTLIISAINYYFYYSFLKNKIIPLREATYKNEKIIRIANILKKPAIIKDEIEHEKYYFAFYYTFHDRVQNKLYPTCAYIKYLNILENNIYNYGYIFMDDEHIEKEFSLNGVLFTKDELKNINFNKLKDKNFILNIKK